MLTVKNKLILYYARTYLASEGWMVIADVAKTERFVSWSRFGSKQALGSGKHGTSSIINKERLTFIGSESDTVRIHTK